MNNPNGNWSSGYRLRDDLLASGWGNFSLFTVNCEENTGVLRWVSGCYTEPDVSKNNNGFDIINEESVFFPTTLYLHLHPGPGNEGADLRWKAPIQGQYQISADFTSHRVQQPWDYCPVSTDVHVLINGQEYFGASIGLDPAVNDGFFTLEGSFPGTPAPSKHFTTTIPLQRNDTIDFIVGDGRNWYACDSTGVKATIVKTTGVIPPIPTRPTPPVCTR